MEVAPGLNYVNCFYRTRVRSAATPLSLTNLLTIYNLLSRLIDRTLACEDATQNLLRLWLLLMLMLRNVLTTVCCRFGSWSFGHKIEFLFRLWAQGLVKIKAQARFWSWILVSILLLMLGWGYEVESWSIFWSKLTRLYNFFFQEVVNLYLKLELF